MIGKEITVTDNAYLKGMPMKQAAYAVGSAIRGYAESWLNPTFLLELCAEFDGIRKNKKTDLSNIINMVGTTAGYAFGMSNHVRDIMDNPNDFIAYVPVITNFIGLSVAEIMYRNRAREGFENR